LLYLIEQRHRVVTRDELLSAVWPNQSVGEETLTSCVKAARRALGDSGQVQCTIQTVHGRGLRFIAEVTLREAVPVYDPASAPPWPLAPDMARAELFIGRQAELAALHRSYAMARQGTRQVIFITGDPGVGKTALLDAFLPQLCAEGAVWVAYGQCIDQYGPGEAYLPMLEALGRLCRGPQGSHFLSWLQRQAPSWLAQMPALLPLAEREAVVLLAHDATQARMLRELAEALEQLTQEQPLVLVLEDLHWSDTATLEWLSYVARRRDPAGLLILATYRSAEARASSHPVDALAHDLAMRELGCELVIGPLSEAEVGQYVSRRLGAGSLAERLAPVLYERTQGHALYLVTMMTDWQQRGLVHEDGQSWERSPSVDATTMGVPEALRYLIEQQIARLSLTEQAIVSAASVAGVEFTSAAVAAGMDGPVDEVEAQCAALSRHGPLIHASGTATWPDGTETERYRFAHALYQEVVYSGLSGGLRTRMHRQIGERLERGYGARAYDIAAELAVHFQQGREVERSIHYLQQAAENSRRRHANHEVTAHCHTGLKLLSTLSQAPDNIRRELTFQAILGPTLSAIQGYAAPEVECTYARARELCRSLGDPPELFTVLFGQALWHTLRGQYQPAQELAEQLLHIAHQQRDPVPLTEAHTLLGTILMTRNDLASGRFHLEAGLALYRLEQHRAHIDHYGQDPVISGLHFLSQTLWLQGYPDQAFARLDTTLHLARQLSHPTSRLFSLNSAVLLHQNNRNGHAVQQWAEAMITLATEQEVPYWLTLGRMYQGWGLAVQGHMAEGIEQIQQGLAIHRANGARVVLGRWLGLLAELHGRAGHFEAGRAVLAEACDLVLQAGMSSFVMGLYCIRGDFLLHTGDRHLEGEAEAQLHQALAIARQHRAKAYELRAALSLARLWRRQGKRDLARELLAPIYLWFAEGLDTADLRDARTLLEDLAWTPPEVRTEPYASPYAHKETHSDAA
jgi:predicted ATPase